MALTKTISLLSCTALSLSLLIGNAAAKGIKTNNAHMQAMDKITGKVSEIDIPVNGEVKFGSFSIVVRNCTTNPPEETPENAAFVDVVDNYDTDKPVNIFRGWMFSSSPALNAIEHPIYDVWLLNCINKKQADVKLLSAEELRQREEIIKAEKLTEQAKMKDNFIQVQPKTEAENSEKVLNNSENTPDIEPVEKNNEDEPQIIKAVANEPETIAVPTEYEEGAPQPLLAIAPQESIPSEVKTEAVDVVEETVNQEQPITTEDAQLIQNVFEQLQAPVQAENANEENITQPLVEEDNNIVEDTANEEAEEDGFGDEDSDLAE